MKSIALNIGLKGINSNTTIEDILKLVGVYCGHLGVIPPKTVMGEWDGKAEPTLVVWFNSDRPMAEIVADTQELAGELLQDCIALYCPSWNYGILAWNKHMAVEDEPQFDPKHFIL